MMTIDFSKTMPLIVVANRVDHLGRRLGCRELRPEVAAGAARRAISDRLKEERVLAISKTLGKLPLLAFSGSLIKEVA